MAEPHHDKQGMDPQALWRVLRNRRGIIVLSFVLTVAAALLFSFAQQKQYSASASLLFRDPQLDQKLFGSTYFAPASDPQRQAATNTRLASLEVIAARASRALGSSLSPGAIQSEVQVEQQGQSDVVAITATDHRPALAANLANTFAKQYILFRQQADRAKIRGAQLLVQRQLTRSGQSSRDRRSLQDRAEQLQILASLQTGNAELVQPAGPPSSPSYPKPVRNGVLGGVLGLLLGLGLAFLVDRLDRRLRDPREIEGIFHRPILGAIPESKAIAGIGKSKRLEPGEAEAFRMLRANLRYFNVDHEITSVLITSSAPGDGKSTVAHYLAAAAAAAGRRVLLLEADLRHPTLAARLQIEGHRGLSQALAGGGDVLQQVVQKVQAVGRRGSDSGARTMDVIVAGPIPPNPTDLIESERMRLLIAEAGQSYDLVVVDTPPTSVVSDAIPLVKQVSGVLVVCRLGKTTRESASHLRAQLENLNANLLGVVLNVVGRQAGYYGYGYGGGYGNRYGGKGPEDQEMPTGGAQPTPPERTPGVAPGGEESPREVGVAVAERDSESPNGARSSRSPSAPHVGASKEAGGVRGRLGRRRRKRPAP